MQRNQAARRWGWERCLRKSLIIRSFPVLVLSGGAGLALGRAKEGSGEKTPKNLQFGDQELAACDTLPADREPKWKSLVNSDG
jgi:hypothetical protein